MRSQRAPHLREEITFATLSISGCLPEENEALITRFKCREITNLTSLIKRQEIFSIPGGLFKFRVTLISIISCLSVGYKKN